MNLQLLYIKEVNMNLNNINLKQFPPQITKKLRKKILCRLIIFLVLTLILAIILINYGSVIFDMPQDEGYDGFKYTCYAIVLILPIFITKIYKIFTDTNYAGVVKNVKIKTVVDSKNQFKPSREMLYRKNEIYLTIQTKQNKIVKKKVYEGVSKLGANLDTYNVGDEVLHLHGTGVTIVLSGAKDTHCSCAMCGGVNNISDENCSHCGLPLIKSIE